MQVLVMFQQFVARHDFRPGVPGQTDKPKKKSGFQKTWHGHGYLFPYHVGVKGIMVVLPGQTMPAIAPGNPERLRTGNRRVRVTTRMS
jgi:hypothetical protein